ncbi:MAG: 2-C-methyl-D-erythritol 2,4-cyclodiphosphate synthase [Balneolales bacterium]
MIRIGYGYDVHRLETGRKLLLGGVEVPFDRGLIGHSDADVLIHAIIDSLLGAMAKGDIGHLFPDTDRVYKNADSRNLLRETIQLIRKEEFLVGNIDATIVAQRPTLQPYIRSMRENISEDLGIELNLVSVKATTSENIGMIGREEGMCAMAVSLLIRAR